MWMEEKKKFVADPTSWFDTGRDWPTDRRLYDTWRQTQKSQVPRGSSLVPEEFEFKSRDSKNKRQQEQETARTRDSKNKWQQEFNLHKLIMSCCDCDVPWCQVTQYIQ
jgi:hypothetical protein